MKEASKVLLILSVIFTIITLLTILVFAFVSFSIDVNWVLEKIPTVEIGGQIVEVTKDVAAFSLNIFRAMMIMYLILELSSTIIQFISLSKIKNENYESIAFPIVTIVIGFMTSFLMLIAGVLWTISTITSKKNN